MAAACYCWRYKHVERKEKAQAAGLKYISNETMQSTANWRAN